MRKARRQTPDAKLATLGLESRMPIVCLVCLSASGHSDSHLGASSCDSGRGRFSVAGDPHRLADAIRRPASGVWRLASQFRAEALWEHSGLAHNVSTLEAAHAQRREEESYHGQDDERHDIDIGRGQPGNVTEG